MFFTRWLATRQHRKLTNLGLKLKKDFQVTQEIREKNYKESLEKQANDLRKECSDTRQRDHIEWNKQRKELEDKISSLEGTIVQQSQMHKSKQRALRDKFEKEDKERVLELAILKDRLELQEQQLKAHQRHWDENANTLKTIIFEVSARLESRAFINRDIIVKTKRLDDEQRLLENCLKALSAHEEKVTNDNKYLQIEKLQIPDKDYDVSPGEE
jgi:hypothetical protein